MFMVGQGERLVAVGPLEQHHCPRCDENKDFEPQLTYKFGQFDLLFGFVYGKRYQLACQECNYGWLLDSSTMEQTLGKVPIPFHLRFGFLILIGLAVVVGTAAYAVRQAA